MCRIDNDAYIEEYKKLTDMVHKNGANIIAQLHTLRDLDFPVEEIHRVADLLLLKDLLLHVRWLNKQELI